MFVWLTQRNKGSNVITKPTTDKELVKVFETLWIAENVDNKWNATKALSDDDYIKYHKWEKVHCERMSGKYLSNVIRFLR
jgi:hypothetical protein